MCTYRCVPLDMYMLYYAFYRYLLKHNHVFINVFLINYKCFYLKHEYKIYIK